MTAVEIVARALATARAQGKWGKEVHDEDSHVVRRFAEAKWPEHEMQAKRLIRSLMDQPPHVTDAGAGCYSRTVALNEMLEAMARG